MYGIITLRLYSTKMGSGISITKQQAIYIIQRELTRVFEEEEKNRSKVDSTGYLVYETFDAESNYVTKLRDLERFLRKNAVQ